MSTAWWKEQSKGLFALIEEHELGMMSSMVTITHNDLVPEMLANIRRGPFAAPTGEEKIEYLLTRVRSDRQRADFENYGMEHVLSYQRRIAATKENFFKRNRMTPLGIMRDYWDRTEAQMRAALHAHILCFFKPREMKDDYKSLPALTRVVPGHEPKQRPRDSAVPSMGERQEDNVYQTHHVGHMTAEMVRPDVSGPGWGGYDVEKLRIAGLARAVQSRLPYCHACNPAYCLKDRTSCRRILLITHPPNSGHIPLAPHAAPHGPQFWTSARPYAFKAPIGWSQARDPPRDLGQSLE